MPVELPDDQQLQAAQEVLGVEFLDPSLLQRALLHDSYLNENPSSGLESNERLEFLGDSTLNYIVARVLFDRSPESTEGDLTARRAQAVRRETLAVGAKNIGLGDFLVMGKGEEASGGAEKERNLADTFEAVVGAITLDSGLETAQEFVVRWLGPEVEAILSAEPPKDPKSRLQELLQAVGRPAPSYNVVKSLGPEDDRRFVVEVIIEGEPAGRGEGRRKVDAERGAAADACEQIGAASQAQH